MNESPFAPPESSSPQSPADGVTAAQEISRRVERGLFGGLLGALAGVLGARVIVLFMELSLMPLLLLLLLSGWTGVFVSYFAIRSPVSTVDALQEWAERMRGVFLKAMLWLLGVAAALGVVAVLTTRFGYLDKVAATVFATAVSAGLLWPTSMMLDRDRSRAAGLFGMVCVVVVFTLTTPLIWEFGEQAEEVAGTALIVGLLAFPGMVFLLLSQRPATRVSGHVGMVLYAIAFAVFLVAVWHAGGWREREPWWTSGWSLVCLAPIGTVCLLGVGTTPGRWWRWLGVLAAAAAWLLMLQAAWSSTRLPEKAFTVLISIGIVVAHANGCMFVPLRPGQRWLRIATITAVIATAVFVDWQVLVNPRGNRGDLSVALRLAGACGILASCGTLALIVLARLNRTGQPPGTCGATSSIVLYCPRCRRRQTLRFGGDRCQKCALEIAVEVHWAETGEASPAGVTLSRS